jgi:oligopeptide/dipeptide ABC transporter ATP-binding protein
MRAMAEPLLEVDGLQTWFDGRGGTVKAVDGVSFTVGRGETLGLVGESGSGKSMTCTSLLRLVPEPGGRIVGGRIVLNGRDLLGLSQREMRAVRGSELAMILQDPLTSLNPAYTIGAQVAEAIRMHQRVSGRELEHRVVDILRRVGIPAPERRAQDYPHQLSGGMRQRVAGAIALSCQPDLLIADEPTTALDATVGAQYLQLLKDLQAEFDFGMIFVTHDLGIISRVCDKVAIMYAGRIVESADTQTIFTRPAHPYTAALIGSIPDTDRPRQRLVAIPGQPPVPRDLPPGCAFAPRCPKVMDRCRVDDPGEFRAGPNQMARCWLVPISGTGHRLGEVGHA